MRFEYDLDKLSLDSEGSDRLAFTVYGDLNGESFVLHSHFDIQVEIVEDCDGCYAKVRAYENEDGDKMHVHAVTLDLDRVLDDFTTTKAYASAIEREMDTICADARETKEVRAYLREESDRIAEEASYNRDPYAYYGLRRSDFY